MMAPSTGGNLLANGFATETDRNAINVMPETSGVCCREVMMPSPNGNSIPATIAMVTGAGSHSIPFFTAPVAPSAVIKTPVRK